MIRKNHTSAVLSAPGRLRRMGVLLLLLVSVLFVPVVLTGCAGGGPFTPQPNVAASADQALADGKTQEAAAQKLEAAGSKTEAATKWADTATYYGAVARKFAGTKDGLAALRSEARVLADGAKNLQAAHVALRNGLKQYPATSFPEHAQAQQEYDALIGRLDAENAKTPWYKVMDGLVKILGGNDSTSPVLAIFVVAFGVSAVLWPLRTKQYRSFKEMQRYQPEMKRIQEKYKGDMALQGEKIREFQKEHGINPMAGCLPAIAQAPVTIAMYQVILHYQFHFTKTSFLWVNQTNGAASQLWPAPLTGIVGHHLGELDYPLLILYAASMFLQTKLTPASDPATAEQQKVMSIMMPGIFFIMMLQWQPASAFVLYWLVSNLIAIGQQWFIYKRLPNLPPIIGAETAAEMAAEGKRVDGVTGTLATDLPGARTGPRMVANPKLVSPKNRKKR